MKARMRSQTGFTLIEVLVGILIFALGMMALAQLQGNLSKSSADSNARTVALNIAEETVESLRSFSQVTASNTVDAFNNIVSGTETVSRGGLNYTVTRTVTDYYYHADGTFLPDPPNGDILNADLKRLELTVSWSAGQTFQVDQDTPAANLGTGSVTLTDLISSITIASGAKTVLNGASGLYAPPVDYSPGENPDIISIQLGDNKFKESTTPLPDVVRTDQLVETRFDVVTYSQSGDGATFLRREEFRAVSCECTLRIPDAEGEGGLRPTIWEGNDYTEAEFIAKPFGESANNLQSDFCDLCCRDHHDGGISTDPETKDDPYDPGRSLYNPFRASTDYHSSGAVAGDHIHYKRTRDGSLAAAVNDGDVYLEACRLVRKDGFFRVAQDLRQEGLNAFPANYLDEDGEVGEYSNYVTKAVGAFEDSIGDGYEQGVTVPSLVEPQNLHTLEGVETPLIFPASTSDLENRTMLPTVVGANSQQLRSRGIYIDYMSDVLRGRIMCLEGLEEGGIGADCGVPAVTSSLEIIPFYDVQLTWLARWTETPDNNPIDVTNEAIQNNNEHDRGIASLQSGGIGPSTINSAVHAGNLGLTGTDPIDPTYASEVEDYNLYALAVEDAVPSDTGYYVTGSITSGVNGVKAADVEIVASNAECDRTNTGYHCFVQAGANNPRIEVNNYNKPNAVLVGCSLVLSTHGQEHIAENGIGNWTRFNLPATEMTGADIVIQKDYCDEAL